MVDNDGIGAGRGGEVELMLAGGVGVKGEVFALD